MVPNEVAEPVRFDRDEGPRAYDREYAGRYWRVLVQVDRVLKVFRARYVGKCSPVHYFWGAPDLAVTRFSGRTAPLHPGGIPHLPDWITRDAYSHEVSSCGFWAGGGQAPYAAFYAYAYPAPAGFAEATVLPDAAFYQRELGEFVLPYDAVREAADPEATCSRFARAPTKRRRTWAVGIDARWNGRKKTEGLADLGASLSGLARRPRTRELSRRVVRHTRDPGAGVTSTCSHRVVRNASSTAAGRRLSACAACATRW